MNTRPPKDILAARKFDRIFQCVSAGTQEAMLWVVDWLMEHDADMDMIAAKCVLIQTLEFVELPIETQRHEAQAGRQKRILNEMAAIMDSVEV